MASKPANLSSAGQKPPAWLSATPPVVGDLQVAVQRLWPLMGRPVVALRAKVRVLRGSKALMPGGVLRHR